MSDPSTESKTSFLGKLKKYLDFKLLGVLFPYFKQYKKLLSLSFVLMLGADLLAVCVPLFIQYSIDENIIKGDSEGLSVTVKWLTLVITVGFFMRISANYSIAFFGQKLLYALRLKLFDKVLNLSNDYYDRVPTGTTLTHVTNDVESVRQFVSGGIVSVLSSMTKVFFVLVCMLYLNVWLGIVTIFCIPIFAFATHWFKSHIRDGFRGVRKANSEINTQLVESLNGYREIMLFQNKDASLEKFDRNNYAYYESYKGIVHAYALYLPLIENITHLSTLLILIIAHLGTGQMILIGEIFAFFTLINMFFRPLRELAEQFNTFQSALAALERIKNIQDEEITVKDEGVDNANFNKNIAQKIVFEKVNFSYKKDQPVLKEISFSIEAKEKIALVGHTGAGKSTINHLINRLYDYQSGEITMGGIEIKNLSLNNLRSSIATIPQDVFLFTGNILDNIRLFDESISEEDVKETIKTLKLENFIHGLPEGLHTHVNEGGSALSNGEKQLIAFARAFVKRPGLIIFDEATANVDSVTEKQIDVALNILLKNHSAIIIAHRLSTIESVDRILFLKDGQVVESGSHEELMALRGLYHRLYTMQALSLSE